MRANNNQPTKIMSTSTQSAPAAGQSFEDPVFLTQLELCKRWKKHPMSIYRYRRSGLLPSRRIGAGKILFALSDILRIEADSVC